MSPLQEYNPDTSSLNYRWQSFIRAFVYNEQPPALKKMMVRRDIVRIIQTLSIILGAFWLFWEMYAFVILINSAHKEAIVPFSLLLLLLLIVMAICLAPMIAFIISLEYERIEVNEHGLMRQHSLMRRFVRWDEVCLFAVGGKYGSRFEWFELSGAKALARWPSLLKSAGTSDGPRSIYLIREAPGLPYRAVTPYEYLDQLRYIGEYAQQRTGQPLCDLRH